MCDNLHLDSIKQCDTPLNTLFFSDFNTNLLQRGIRQAFKDKTGIAIDYQNVDDLYGIMRMVFINNSGDHYNQVKEQVKAMNTRDINTISTPLDQPINTSTTGKKIDFNNKIGIN